MDFLCEKKLSERNRNKAPSREKITTGKCLRELTGVTLESAGISIMYHEAFPCDEDHEVTDLQSQTFPTSITHGANIEDRYGHRSAKWAFGCCFTNFF